MELGYRDPMTYKQLHTIDSMKLTRHVLSIERFVQKHENVLMHQYIHEIMSGKDPYESEWYKKYIENNTDNKGVWIV